MRGWDGGGSGGSSDSGGADPRQFLTLLMSAHPYLAERKIKGSSSRSRADGLRGAMMRRRTVPQKRFFGTVPRTIPGTVLEGDEGEGVTVKGGVGGGVGGAVVWAEEDIGFVEDTLDGVLGSGGGAHDDIDDRGGDDGDGGDDNNHGSSDGDGENTSSRRSDSSSSREPGQAEISSYSILDRHRFDQQQWQQQQQEQRQRGGALDTFPEFAVDEGGFTSATTTATVESVAGGSGSGNGGGRARIAGGGRGVALDEASWLPQACSINSSSGEVSSGAELGEATALPYPDDAFFAENLFGLESEGGEEGGGKEGLRLSRPMVPLTIANDYLARERWVGWRSQVVVVAYIALLDLV